MQSEFSISPDSSEITLSLYKNTDSTPVDIINITDDTTAMQYGSILPSSVVGFVDGDVLSINIQSPISSASTRRIVVGLFFKKNQL
jgi:hypothetical protein